MSRDPKRQQIFDLGQLAFPDTLFNEQILKIIRTVVETYGPQDIGAVSKSVEDVEISTVDQPDQKLAIRDAFFHLIVLVPSRVEVTVN